MLFDIVTIFPDFFRSPLEEGVLHRAISQGIVRVRTTNLRDFATDRHRTVDDRPYGGGDGMVMKPEPLHAAIEHLKSDGEAGPVILLSPRGELLDQAKVRELACFPRIILVCGRYEGVDERFRECCADLELSIGDYILTGGEIAALVVIDSVSRHVPGVLGCETSAEEESFTDGLLEYPQYTRPPVFHGMAVPEVLVSGDHARIARWRRNEALRITLERRPELLRTARLTQEDREELRRLGWPS
ncbi:MAG: tRNA (guanosine(37)-N1)-methyltransferase TrmD [Deltaproteobacteria bacterium]